MVGNGRYMYTGRFDLDASLARYLPLNGTFLEVGANDGVLSSNTFSLENAHNWRGILIEPLPDLYRICRVARRRSYCVQAACVREARAGSTVEFVAMDDVSIVRGARLDGDDGWLDRWRGRQQRVIRVPARTLSSIIDESPFDTVDFMSIDVEGGEFELLAGLDLDRHAPGWMLVETDLPERLSAVLAPAMEFVEALTFHDYLYRRA